jgi:hypothetical protein
MRDIKNKIEIIERKTVEIEVLKRNLDDINTRAIRSTSITTEKFITRCVRQESSQNTQM